MGSPFNYLAAGMTRLWERGGSLGKREWWLLQMWEVMRFWEGEG